MSLDGIGASKDQKNNSHSEYLIVKKPSTNEYKINIPFILKQLYRIRWFAIIVIPVLTFAGIYFAIKLPLQYRIVSVLTKPSSNNYKNVFLPNDEIFNKIKMVSDVSIKLANGDKIIQLHLSAKKVQTSLDNKLFNRFKSKLTNTNNLIEFLEKSDEAKNASTGIHKNTSEYKIKITEQLLNKFNLLDYHNGRLEYDTLTTDPVTSLKVHNSYIDFTNNKIIQQLILSQKLIVERKINQLRDEIVNLQQAIQINEKNTPKNNENSIILDLELKKLELTRLESLSFNASDLSSYNFFNKTEVRMVPIKQQQRLYVLIGFSLGILITVLYLVMKSNIIEPNTRSLELKN